MAPYSFKNSALKYMLAHVPGKDGEELLSYFGEHQRKEIREALDLPENPFTTTIPPKEWLTFIHPLWVKEGINSCLPPAELYLNIIPKESQEQFAAIDEKILTPLGQEFFLFQLIQQIIGSFHFVSPRNLPPHPLNQLATLLPSQFEEYCKIMGLYDLALELKLIINPQLLKQIDAYFSPLEKKCIRDFSQKKDLLKFTSLKLSEWNGNIEELTNVLYFRGLNRVAKGVYDGGAPLLWYIERKIPPKQISFLHTFKTPIHEQKIHTILTKQLIECIDIILTKPQEESSL